MIEVQLQPIEENFRAENYSYSTTIHQLFETQVEKTPNQIAVSFEDSSLTYRQLNERANQIAHYLIELGVKPEQLIGICVERSLEMIIGVLGVLKAGGGYVPLDPAYPKERLKFILEDADISILLTQEKPLINLPLDQIKVIFLNKDQSLVQQSQENPKTAVNSDNLAYILYTSGSTGLPKGVLITHKGVVNLVQTEIKLFNLDTSSRVLQFASLNFDASVSEIFTAISSGAQLCLTCGGQLA
jgi:non-ribosomal peptide synthetase component F